MGPSVIEYLCEKAKADFSTIYNFIRTNADVIISETMQDLKRHKWKSNESANQYYF